MVSALSLIMVSNVPNPHTGITLASLTTTRNLLRVANCSLRPSKTVQPALRQPCAACIIAGIKDN